MTYTHLIAIDRASDTLWGGVPIAAGIAGLRAEIITNLSPVGIQEADEDGNPVRVTGEALADRCDFFRVVLGDDAYEPPANAPLASSIIYSGHEMGYLPDDRAAAWGERA